jgi:alpha/beta superfamily hydrolase
LLNHYPALPYTIAGFSFGSRVTLRLGCQLPDCTRLIVAGYPTRIFEDKPWMHACTRDKLFIQSTHDEHGPLAELEKFVEAVPDPKKLITIPAEDHFFAGALPELEETILRAAQPA